MSLLTKLRRAGRRAPFIKRLADAMLRRRGDPLQVFSIGILTGETPLSLAATASPGNPVLTARDVVDRDAAFVADPFMIKVGGTWFMFFEVMPRTSPKGVIGLASSRDGSTWTYERIVLEEPFHLSYPHVFTWQDEVFMVPETHEAETVRLYRAVNFPTSWRYERDLITGRPFSDATSFQHDDHWWMFAETDAGRRHDLLRLYTSRALLGPWREHPMSPVVKRNPHAARPAGRVVMTPDGPVRFSQDCYPVYGSAVTAHLITELTADRYAERPLGTQPLLQGSGRSWNAGGMHHIDLHPVPGGWIACVDGWFHEPAT